MCSSVHIHFCFFLAIISENLFVLTGFRYTLTGIVMLPWRTSIPFRYLVFLFLLSLPNWLVEFVFRFGLFCIRSILLFSKNRIFMGSVCILLLPASSSFLFLLPPVHVFRLIVALFSFLESDAIFIDFYFFTVISAGLTKQSSVTSVARSSYPFFINLFSFRRPGLVGGLVMVFLFCRLCRVFF